MVGDLPALCIIVLRTDRFGEQIAKAPAAPDMALEDWREFQRMAGAGPASAPGKYLPALRNEFPELGCSLIVDARCLLHAEGAHFSSWSLKLAARPAAWWWFCHIIS